MKVNGVVLGVSVNDYDRAIQFYVNDLGMFEIVANTTISDDRRYVCVALKEFVPMFQLRFRLSVAESPLSPSSTLQEPLVTLPVEDAVQLHARLCELDCDVDGEVVELPYGAYLLVTDPFGNVLSLFERYTSRFTEL